MGHQHVSGAALAHRAQQSIPVSVVREHEAPTGTPPTPHPPHGHPAAGEAGLGAGKPFHPATRGGGGWGQHQAPGQAGASIQLGQWPGGGQLHARLAVRLDQRMYRPVQEHLLLHPQLPQLRQHPLGLAKGVAEEHRGPSWSFPPPVQQLRHHLPARSPAVDRQPEGGFGDQPISTHRLEGFTARVGLALVVTAHQPAFTARLQPDLGRAEHVTGGMEGDPRIPEPEVLAVGQRMQLDASPEAPAQDSLAAGDRPVGTAAGAGMVGVGVGEQGPGHRPNRIDPGPGGRAVQALGGEPQQAIGR